MDILIDLLHNNLFTIFIKCLFFEESPTISISPCPHAMVTPMPQPFPLAPALHALEASMLYLCLNPPDAVPFPFDVPFRILQWR
jgi:hypothetical protein